jgi:photosystem II stability/assembly factor-like uncharacterized protein
VQTATRWGARLAAALAVMVGGGVTFADDGPVGGGAEPAAAEVRVEGEDRGEARPLALDAHPRIQAKAEKIAREGLKRFDQPDERMAFFMAQRLGPGMTQYPIDQVMALTAEIEAREARLDIERTQPGGIVTWQELGPGNVGGRTRAIVIDPVDPDILYAGGVAGGVWKTTDGGASWIALDDAMLNLAVTTIVMDPNDRNTLYAGTGEGFFNIDAVRGLGIFKTTDAGATWTRLASTDNSDFYYVNELAISPNTSNRIYAATRAGLLVSNDAGGSWTLTRATATSFVGCTDVAVRSDVSPDVVLAAFGSFVPEGLFRSTDNGVTWAQVGFGSDLTSVEQGRIELAFAPSDNNIVYACIANNGDLGTPTGTLVDVVRSTDGGLTWSNRVNFADPNDINPWLLTNHIFVNGCAGTNVGSQGWYDNVIAVDPTDPDRVWVGGIDAFRSENGGTDWELFSYWYIDGGFPQGLHADQHAIVFHPGYDGATNQTVYFGNDGGVYRSDNVLAATSIDGCPELEEDLADITFVDLNNGYGTTQFYNGDSAVGLDRFAGGTQDNGTNLVDSAGTPNAWFEIVGGDGGYTEIDPTDPDIIYAEVQFFPEIRKSVDGGATFVDAVTGITDTDGLFITPFEMDPSDPLTLWTGGSRPWRTTNGAASWTLGSADVADPLPLSDRISAIAVAPTDSEVVYLGFENGTVARTSNGRAATPTWSEFDGSNGLPLGYVSSVAVDPTDADTAYATYSTFGIDHVFRTTDGGTTWVSIDGVAETGIPDIPVHWLAIKPDNSQNLYAGTEIGVFVSENGGGDWAPANIGFPRTVVETLEFPTPTRIVAYTHGRGAFLADLGEDCNANGIDDEIELVHVNLPADAPDNDAALTRDPVAGFALSEFTVELWFRNNGSGQRSLFSYNGPFSDNELTILDVNSLDIAVGGVFSFSTFDAEATGNVGDWNHLSIAWRSSDGFTSIRVNGVEVATRTINPGDSVAPGGRLYLGQEQDAGAVDPDPLLDPNQAFFGDLRQVRLWSVFRTPGDVLGDYREALTGTEENLVSYWPLDDGAGTIATDLAGANNLDLIAPAAWADNDANGDGILDGCVRNITTERTFPTIQDAIDAANSGEIIEAQPGTYVESIDFLGKAITLRSATGDPADTIIDGAGAFRVVQCVSGEGPDTVLEGFTISGGNADGSFPNDRGGGMYNVRQQPDRQQLRVQREHRALLRRRDVQLWGQPDHHRLRVQRQLLQGVPRRRDVQRQRQQPDRQQLRVQREHRG